MKVHRGITVARQRVSRGGNNLFPRYNTSAAIPSSATVNRACDQHPLAGVELRRVGTSCMGKYIVPTLLFPFCSRRLLTGKRLEREPRFRREKGNLRCRRRRRH